MATSVVRLGIAGCGLAARIHLERLLAVEGVAIVGCADPDLSAARALADRASAHGGVSQGTPPSIPAFADHRELLDRLAPDALLVFTPHLTHYRLAMDALQKGCHLFIEKPLSGNLQEATDIASLARSRQLKVGVGHQYRLCPSLAEARRRLAEGVIGPVRLITAVLARPRRASLGTFQGAPALASPHGGSGVLAEAGDHLIDALLWTTGQVAKEVGAIQARWDSPSDVVTAAAIRLADGTPVSVAVSGIAPGPVFAIDYFGEQGRLRATDQTLEQEQTGASPVDVPLAASSETIDSNFVAAVTTNTPLCCPADEALDTVRLFEAIARSAATGQIVRVI